MTRAQVSPYRIPTLDGWRGIAVLLVLVFHFQEFYGNRYFFNLPAFGFGEHGVMIFLVLSGFLITTNLRRQETIDLRRFYIKRFFRLMPAAWVYLAYVFIGGLLVHGAWGNGRDVLASLTFHRNFYIGTGFERRTTHFWSLSLEEQFYFSWPLLLGLVPRRALMWLLSLSAVFVAFYRIAHSSVFFPPQGGFPQPINRTWQVDEIIVGCLFAFAFELPSVLAFFARYGRTLFWTALPIFLFDVVHFQEIPPLHETILFAGMMGATLTNPWMWPSRVLEMSHLKTTGLLCYGIYLWQGVCFTPEMGMVGVMVLPLVVLASWFLIERPSQRLCARILAGLGSPTAHSAVKGGPVRDLVSSGR